MAYQKNRRRLLATARCSHKLRLLAVFEESVVLVEVLFNAIEVKTEIVDDVAYLSWELEEWECVADSELLKSSDDLPLTRQQSWQEWSGDDSLEQASASVNPWNMMAANTHHLSERSCRDDELHETIRKACYCPRNLLLDDGAR